MKTKKLNFIRGLRDRLRLGLPLGTRLMVLALAVLLFATPALASGQGEVPQEVLPNKPEITVQGNLVVDNGKPTGFYELALCVKSPRRIEGPDPNAGYSSNGVLSEDDYLQVLKDIDAGTATDGTNTFTTADYDIKYYPFTAASAVVGVNADILTAVGWNVTDVTYAAWDSDNNEYKANNTDYPWGIDVSANTPAEWDDLDADPFPKVDKAKATGLRPTVIALDAAGDSANTFTVAAQVVDYHEDGSNNTNTAFITMSANAHGNKPVVFKESTPVVVIRFSYDLKRFPKAMVNKDYNEARDLITGALLHATDQITGDPTGEDQTGFWIGFDRGTGQSLSDGKTPLTWLADSKLDGGSNFKKFEEKIAQTEVDQSVWTRWSTKATTGGIASGSWDETSYYYYLGAEGNTKKEPRAAGSSILVDIGGVPTTVDHVSIPDTICPRKVLTLGETENPAVDTTIDADWTDKAGYTYFENLLHLSDETLRIKMVNDETYRKSTGGIGGTQILFYDWDDTLIGALIVGEGDVRADVNGYVERNFIAPPLRASQYLNDGELPTEATALTNYQNVVNSLDREHTYRGGTYPYQLGGSDAMKDTSWDNYPLTNKLDYVFYKRLNIVNTLWTPDPGDPTNTDLGVYDHYYTVAKASDDAEAGKYPYIYGWAIVDDPANKEIEVAGENWKVWKDSVQTENTWTTFGTGELSSQEPAHTEKGRPVQTIPTGTNEVQPGGLSAALTSPTDYDYMISSAEDNGYLCFADFGDMSKMLKKGQNVLIVKAVYEPGTDLLPNDMYMTVDDSLYVTRYGTNASTQDSTFSFQYQYQRANNSYGDWQGVRRVRDPAVQAGLTYDVNAFDTDDKDWSPVTDTKAFYVKTIAYNKDIMDIDLTAGGVIWKVDYVLVDLYGGYNVVTGTKRSRGGELNLKNNFEYKNVDNSGDEIPYSDRQGTNGFITEGTIHQLMEVSTAVARGEGGNLENTFTLATINDLNLRVDKDTQYSVMDYTLCSDYLQGLVDAIVTAYPDPATAPAGIYNKKGNVDLTWHQLQRHIVMCEAGNTNGIFDGTTLMSDADCAGFLWCRMDNCVGNLKMDINSVSDVLKALYLIQTKPNTDNDYKRAYEAIYGSGGSSTGVTGSFLNGFGYRMQADGVPYDYDPSFTDDDIKAAILADLDAVVTALKPTLGANPDWSTVSWTKIQTEIIKDNMGSDAPAVPNIWWQPSTGKPYGTPPTPANWEEVLKYSYQEYVGVDLEGDGSVFAKVPHAFEKFGAATCPLTSLEWMIDGDVEGDAAGDYANMGWFRKGVDSTTGECIKFADADEFAAAWIDALKVLAKDGGYDTPDKLKTATWEEIQYAILTAALPGADTAVYKSYADILAETGGLAEGPFKGQKLYWNDGGKPSVKLEDVLKAVSVYTFTNVMVDLNDVLGGSIDPINNDLYLRKTDPMGKFESVQEFADTAADALVELYFSVLAGNSDSKYMGDDGQTLTMDWNEFQWLLLNYTTLTTQPDSSTIESDPTVDYWWKDGGSPKNPMDINTISDLALAAMWYKEGTLLTALDKLTAQDLVDFGLWQDERGLPFPAGTTDAQAIQIIKDAVVNFPYPSAVVGSKSEDDLQKELQYAILNSGEYKPAASITDDYWWHGTGGPAITDQKSLLKAAWLYYVGDGAGTTTSRALDEMPAAVSFINNRKNGLALRKDSEGANFDSTAEFLTELESVLKSGITYEQAIGMTNYQLQYMLLGGSYKSDADVKAEVIDTSDPSDPVDAYWWFSSDTKPGGPGGKEEIPIDPAVWNAFIKSANDYYWNWDADAFTFTPWNDDVVKDTLLLRKDSSGTVVTAAELMSGDPDNYDIIVEVMDAIYAASNAAEYMDMDTAEFIKYPTWYQFQYCLIHRYSLSEVPDEATAKAECKEKYDWKYKDSGGGEPEPPTPGKTEIPVDAATWNAFIKSANDYYWNWDAAAFTFTPWNDDVVKDTLLLRKDSSGTVITASELMSGNPDSYDLIVEVMDAIYAASNGSEYMDMDTAEFIKYPTWYQFQYCLIHRYSLSTIPDDATAKAECEEKYDWKYEEGGGTPPTPPAPTKTEIPVDEAKWNAFVKAANDYYWNWDASAFTFSPFNDEVVRDVLLLRANSSGTELRASDLYSGNPDSYDIIVEIMDAIYAASNGSEYMDMDTAEFIKYPTWYQFQYCLIHRYSLSEVPDEATAKAECEAKYDWKYGTPSSGGGGGGGSSDPEPPVTPSKTEIPVDQTTWNKFVKAANDYYWNWDAAAFTFTPWNDDVVKDTLLLRGDSSGTVITASDLMSGDPDSYDIIVEIMDAIYAASNGSEYMDMDTAEFIKYPTWYQFQYCLIHRYSLSEVPDDATAKAECEAKYDWKYGAPSSGGGGGGSGGGGGGTSDPEPPAPTRSEIPVDQTTWNKFVKAANDYYWNWDASAFTFTPWNNDTVKDTLLLRGDSNGTVITASDLMSGDPDSYDIIVEIMDAIYAASNGSEYMDMDTAEFIKLPTWYQFQYCLIHRYSLSTIPDDDTCKAECEEKYDWKYTTS